MQEVQARSIFGEKKLSNGQGSQSSAKARGDRLIFDNVETFFKPFPRGYTLS